MLALFGVKFLGDVGGQFRRVLLTALGSEGGDRPCLDRIGLEADAIVEEVGQRKSRRAMALVGSQHVQLTCIFDVARHTARAAIIEHREVVLGLGKSALRRTREPGQSCRWVGHAHFAGKVKQTEFILGLRKIAIGGCQQKSVSGKDFRLLLGKDQYGEAQAGNRAARFRRLAKDGDATVAIFGRTLALNVEFGGAKHAINLAGILAALVLC